MAIATGFETKLTISGEESSFGNAETGGFFEVGQKSSSLSLAFENINVERIRGDRNAENILKGTELVSGDITVDLAPDDIHNIMIVSVLCDADDADESGTGSTYIPESTQRSYNIVHQLDGTIDGSGEYQVFRGCQFNSMSLTVGATGTIETTFSVLGQTMVQATAHPGSGVTDATASERIPFTSDDATVSFNSADNGFVTDFSLTIDNGMSAIYTVGDNKPIEGHLGKSTVTGSMTVLFDSDAEYARFVDRSETAINLTIGSGATGVKFEMPRCVLTSGTTEAASDGAVTAAFEFTALFDDSATHAIRFDNHL